MCVSGGGAAHVGADTNTDRQTKPNCSVSIVVFFSTWERKIVCW